MKQANASPQIFAQCPAVEPGSTPEAAGLRSTAHTLPGRAPQSLQQCLLTGRGHSIPENLIKAMVFFLEKHTRLCTLPWGHGCSHPPRWVPSPTASDKTCLPAGLPAFLPLNPCPHLPLGPLLHSLSGDTVVTVLSHAPNTPCTFPPLNLDSEFLKFLSGAPGAGAGAPAHTQPGCKGEERPDPFSRPHPPACSSVRLRASLTHPCPCTCISCCSRPPGSGANRI